MGETVKKTCFWDGIVSYNDPCWFFFVLYEAKILERALNISARNMRTKILVCASSFLLGYAVYRMDIFLPFGLDRCLVGFGFMTAGLCIKRMFLYNYVEYSCAGVSLFRRNGNRQSGGRKPLNRNRDTALKCLLPASLLA